MTRRRALLLYLALSVPFGILVHLGSEFAGLGRDADDLAFSPLHGYLAAMGVGALLYFLVAGGFFASSAERGRRMGLMAFALPFRGRGPAFFLLSAALQFAFFVVTQLGEGCPLCNGDVLIGVLAALVASIVGSFALIALRRQIVRAVLRLCFAIERGGRYFAARRAPRYETRVASSVYSTFADPRGNRPPPPTLLA
jgi:hypothetical protein